MTKLLNQNKAGELCQWAVYVLFSYVYAANEPFIEHKIGVCVCLLVSTNLPNLPKTSTNIRIFQYYPLKTLNDFWLMNKQEFQNVSNIFKI